MARSRAPLLAFGVLVMGLLMTTAVVLDMRRACREQDQQRFSAEVRRRWEALETLIEKHEGFLRSLQDFVAMNLEASPTEFTDRWEARLRSSSLRLNFPGLAEVGFGRVVGVQDPPKVRDDGRINQSTYLENGRIQIPLSHHCRIQPVPSLLSSNFFAAPHMWPIRFAHELNGPISTRPMSLGPSWADPGTNSPIGFRLVAPVYDPKTWSRPSDEPRVLSGVVFATLVVAALEGALIQAAGAEVRLEILMQIPLEVAGVVGDLPFARGNAGPYWNDETNLVCLPTEAAAPPMETNFVVRQYQRPWRIRAYATPSFAAQSPNLHVGWISGLGTALSAAMAAIIWVQVRGREDAMRLAEMLRRSEAEVRTAAATREKLGRELHDRTLQSLLTAETSLASFQQRLAVPGRATDACPSSVSDQLEASVETVREVTRDLRRFVLLMEAPSVDPATFEAGFRDWLQRVNRATGREINLRMQAGFPERAGAGFLSEAGAVVGECISNALRHGQAGRVDVTLVCFAGSVEIRVEDDGMGFDTAQIRRGNGLGNLRARAERFGGRFEIESSEGGPTLARMILPAAEASFAPGHRHGTPTATTPNGDA